MLVWCGIWGNRFCFELAGSLWSENRGE